ncbi:uncharacterized protein LOC131214577, partial [Anopheles bellator]|uniref:uncharacterized protein LOC131214577 n=1 Tax=Anopheles bellator TaxID=139047 RepID=UPI002647A3A2
CVLWVACSFPVALSCDSCGRECASACGTRHFRTCCFNYLRKRSSTPPVAPPGSDRHLELWYAAKAAQKSRPNHRRLADLLLNGAANDIDYEFVPMMAANHQALSEGQPRSGSLGQPSVSSPEPDDSRSSERSVEKVSSEESEPGRLQLLYEA